MTTQNWAKTALTEKIKDLAGRRKLDDLTVGPVLTVSMLYCYINLISVIIRVCELHILFKLFFSYVSALLIWFLPVGVYDRGNVRTHGKTAGDPGLEAAVWRQGFGEPLYTEDIRRPETHSSFCATR